MRTPTSPRTRITVVTAGNLSTCPRMLKAADALGAAGYRVGVVSTDTTSWATAADAAVRRTRRWDSDSVVDYSGATGRALHLKSGLRFKAMRTIARVVGPSRVPASVAIRAYARVHDELVWTIVSQRPDFIYGGTTGALAAVADAARRLRVPYAIDFEDFHSGEHNGPGSDLTNALAARVEQLVIPGARFITAGSPMIADAYGARYGAHPVTIHNTFTTMSDAVAERTGEVLRLYWFSQTLGPQRGLDDVIRAAGEAGVDVELHLRARVIPGFLESIRELSAAVAPRLALVLHEPATPDDMVKLAQPYDAGLACEEPHTLNRQLCLTNKIFTYLAAGIPVLMTRTRAQARLEPELGDAAVGYECGDVAGLARIIGRLSRDRAWRCRSRAAARDAAARRWHWEHADDRGALLAAVAGAIA